MNNSTIRLISKKLNGEVLFNLTPRVVKQQANGFPYLNEEDRAELALSSTLISVIGESELENIYEIDFDWLYDNGESPEMFEMLSKALCLGFEEKNMWGVEATFFMNSEEKWRRRNGVFIPKDIPDKMMTLVLKREESQKAFVSLLTNADLKNIATSSLSALPLFMSDSYRENWFARLLASCSEKPQSSASFSRSRYTLILQLDAETSDAQVGLFFEKLTASHITMEVPKEWSSGDIYNFFSSDAFISDFKAFVLAKKESIVLNEELAGPHEGRKKKYRPKSL